MEGNMDEILLITEEKMEKTSNSKQKEKNISINSKRPNVSYKK